MPATTRFTVGFDLDMTLIDSRPGIAATYRALTARTGVWVDADAAITRLGPPLAEEIARWFPPDAVGPAVDLYRALYPAHAIEVSSPLPGAYEALRSVRAAGGRVLVLTAKKHALAELHIEHLGLPVDALVGGAWAEGKAVVLEEYAAVGYVGDHPTDMAAARAAGAAAVGVLTGDHDEAQLRGAGADVVLDDLTGFAGWLAGAGLDRAPGTPAGSGRC